MHDEHEPFAASGDWLERYQLSQDPFAARPKGFRFFQPRRKEVLAQLHHFARFGDRPVLVTGAAGSGKTLLRQALVASSDKNLVQTIVLAGGELVSAEQLLSQLCIALGSQSRDEAGLIEAARGLARTGLQLWLVVDDAQALQPACLQMLADLAVAGHAEAGIRLFLFGAPEINRLLLQIESPMDGGDGWLQLIRLQPLTRDEMQAYLAERLELAGQGIELFDNEQLDWLYEHSEGWHGAINHLARELLSEPDVAAAKPISWPALPWRSIAALVLVGVGVAIAWKLGDKPEEPVRTVLQLPDPVVEAEITLPVTPVQSGQAAALQAVAEDELDESLGAVGDDQPSLPVASVPEMPIEPAPIAGRDDRVPSAAGPLDPGQMMVDEPTPVSVPEPPAAAIAAAPAPVDNRVASDNHRRPSEPTPGAVAERATLHGADWYRQLNSGEYVLQLLGSRSRQAALDFAGRYHQLSDLAMLETSHEGKPWYVITQGHYSDRQRAQQAIERLPEALRRQSPWPRSVASVQQALP